MIRANADESLVDRRGGWRIDELLQRNADRTIT